MQEFIDLLQRDEYDNISKMVTLFKKAMLTLLNKKIYNPLKFIIFNNSYFSYILKESFSIKNKKINCDQCKKKIKLKIEKKFIKLGDILIFNLENKNKNVQPTEIIDLKNYVDNSLKDEKTRYELFQ